MILISSWQENNVMQEAGSEDTVSKIVLKCTNDAENKQAWDAGKVTLLNVSISNLIWVLKIQDRKQQNFWEI